MKNAYFNEEDLEVLLSYSKIKLVTSMFSEIKPIKTDDKYLKWVNTNSDHHSHREILMALTGNTCFTLNGMTYPCMPGTVFLIDGGVLHDSYYPNYFDNFKHLWCRIVNGVIYTGGPYVRENGCRVNVNLFNQIVDEQNSGLSFSKIWNELSQNKYLDDKFKCECMKNAFYSLVLELCRRGYDKISNPVERETEQHYRAVINPILEHIKETGGKGLDITRLAYIAGYSKFHFARIFKQVTGVSVLEFINSARIEKYRKLHEAGFIKKQISDELGFSCPAAFSRWERDNLRL